MLTIAAIAKKFCNASNRNFDSNFASDLQHHTLFANNTDEMLTTTYIIIAAAGFFYNTSWIRWLLFFHQILTMLFLRPPE
jgi:hypothetical protein